MRFLWVTMLVMLRLQASSLCDARSLMLRLQAQSLGDAQSLMLSLRALSIYNARSLIFGIVPIFFCFFLFMMAPLGAWFAPFCRCCFWRENCKTKLPKLRNFSILLFCTWKTRHNHKKVKKIILPGHFRDIICGKGAHTMYIFWRKKTELQKDYFCQV